MMLEVEAAGTYEPERRYILDVMLRERLGLEWRLVPGERSDWRIGLAGDAGRRLVMPDVLFATAPADWLTPAALPARPLVWCDGGHSGRVPVLYGAGGSGPPFAVAPERVELTVDVLGGAFFMLVRYEEVVVRERDGHGRFAAASSLAHAEGFLDLPVVDAYVELLWTALQRLWPRLARPPRRYRVALSHDVDRPLAATGRRAPGLVRQLGADALVRRDPGLAVRRCAPGRGCVETITVSIRTTRSTSSWT